MTLLPLTLHDGIRAWKSFDWGAMKRLHDKGLIENPIGKAKSIQITEDGLKESERLIPKRYWEGMIRHILLIKFTADSTPSDIEHVKNLFIAIPEKVEGVVSVEWGVNDSPEGKNQGYTHSVLMTFADEAGRENYLPHPEHEALKRVFGPLLDDIVVFDYQV